MKIISAALALIMFWEAPLLAAPAVAHSIPPLSFVPTADKIEPYLARTQSHVEKSLAIKVGLKTKAAFKSSASQHILQLVIIMWSTAWIESIRQKRRLNVRDNKNVALTDDILTMGGASAEEILNNFQIWLGFAGSYAVGTPMQKPIAELMSHLTKVESRAILAGVLTSAVQSTVTFMGFEATSQLWVESIQILDNEEDMTAALKLTVADMMSKDPRARELVAKVMWNGVKILSTDDYRRRLWIYNTWRLRIMTGDFAAILSTSIAGGLAGFYACGHWCSAIGGGVAGVGALLIPQPIKDNITLDLQDVRIQTNQRSLSAQDNKIFQLAATLNQKADDSGSVDFLSREIIKVLEYRKYYRERIVSVMLERFSNAVLAKGEAESFLKMMEDSGAAKAAPGSDAAKLLAEFKEQLRRNDEILLATQYDLIQFYRTEYDALKHALRESRVISDQGFVRLTQEFSNLETLHHNMMFIVVGANPNHGLTFLNIGADAESLASAAQVNLEISRLEGFTESLSNSEGDEVQ